jgi:hypothetical protein
MSGGAEWGAPREGEAAAMEGARRRGVGCAREEGNGVRRRSESPNLIFDN